MGLAAARACWAHPRSCGENAPHLGIQANGPGSSPLMRGKPEVALADCVPVRLIPTHAGKTFVSHLYCVARGSSPLMRGKHRAVRRAGRQRGLIPAHTGKTMFRLRARASRPAYPRLRRENSWDATAIAVSFGSPPHTRGKRPAHAGKTLRQRLPVFPRPAHPRSRGENQVIWGTTNDAVGSSPLTRGKLQVLFRPTRAVRLIPAHAGKTRLSGAPPMTLWALPRSRGENVRVDRDHRLAGGSSPLTRGKRGQRRPADPPNRLIPAHAGKTFFGRRSGRAWPAHPRSRGENHWPRWFFRPSHGSSPLTRGKRGRLVRGVAGCRLIPAHAGKTRCSPTSRGRCTAHPRSRGENRSAATPIRSLVGSSPLTRGKLTNGSDCRPSRRLIPAHAGKTDRHGSGVREHAAHPRSRGENPCV